MPVGLNGATSATWPTAAWLGNKDSNPEYVPCDLAKKLIGFYGLPLSTGQLMPDQMSTVG
jgi:hypothetical protein